MSAHVSRAGLAALGLRGQQWLAKLSMHEPLTIATTAVGVGPRPKGAVLTAIGVDAIETWQVAAVLAEASLAPPGEWLDREPILLIVRQCQQDGNSAAEWRDAVAAYIRARLLDPQGLDVSNEGAIPSWWGWPQDPRMVAAFETADERMASRAMLEDRLTRLGYYHPASPPLRQLIRENDQIEASLACRLAVADRAILTTRSGRRQGLRETMHYLSGSVDGLTSKSPSWAWAKAQAAALGEGVASLAEWRRRAAVWVRDNLGPEAAFEGDAARGDGHAG